MRKAKLLFGVFLVLLPLGLSFAQEQEAGAYARKSVTYIDALWLLDPTARALGGRQVQYILEKVNNPEEFTEKIQHL